MRYGIAIPTWSDCWRVVQRAENAGFSSAWFYDTQLLNAELFAAMGAAAVKTEKIRLGTGVLIPSNRIAPVAAAGLATLNALAPGRIDFGVGTGFTGRRTTGLAAITRAALREYLRIVQGLLARETVEWDFEGLHRKIRFLNPEADLVNTTDPIALHISAMGPKMRSLTADLGAGWLNFLVSGQAGAEHEAAGMRDAWRAAGRAQAARPATAPARRPRPDPAPRSCFTTWSRAASRARAPRRCRRSWHSPWSATAKSTSAMIRPTRAT